VGRRVTAVDGTTDRYGRELSPDPEAERLETNPAQVHFIPMHPTKEILRAQKAGAGIDWHDRGHWATDVVLYVPRGNRTGSDRWKVGYLDDTAIWNQGPGLPRKAGRHGFVFELSTAITADPRMSSAADRERNLARGMEPTVAVGDLLLLECVRDGRLVEQTLWRVVPSGWGGQWIDVELVQR
jgi:hypothetical protein